MKSEQIWRREERCKEVPDVDFDDLQILEKLLKTNKLTDRQKEALHKLIQKYHYVSD